MEPLKENVDGEIVRRHSFSHSINWGYVALAVAAIYLGAKALSVLESAESDADSDATSDSWEDAGS